MSKLPNDSEFIEVVLGLLEKSKQQDESIQKAIKALENEHNDLRLFRNNLREEMIEKVGGELKYNVGIILSNLRSTQIRLNLENSFWYFGGFVLFMALCIFSLVYYLPSFDEIEARRAELAHLNSEIAKMKDIKRLQVSTCEKRLCVKVVESRCNFGKQNERYCVADLK